jgi:hypothetical protein
MWTVFLASDESLLAALRVGLADRNHVPVITDESIDLVRMVEMTVVRIVDVVVVAQGLVSAARAAAMIVVRMGMAVLAHR